MSYTPLQLLPLLPTRADPAPVPSYLTIDPYSDVLWVGSSSGAISAFCTPQLAPNIRFPAPSIRSVGLIPNATDAVREIRAQDREVWSLTESGVGGRRRGGAAKWFLPDPTRSLRCMAPNPLNSHEVLLGGTGPMMLLNTSRSEVVRKFDSSTLVHLSPLSREIIAGSMSGSVSILDPRTGFRPTATVQAHTGGLSCADANGYTIATWGWTHMQGRPLPDPLVRLYDTRKLRPLAPISFPATPAFARLHPANSNQLIIASQQGTFQVADLTNPSGGQYEQLDVKTYVTSMAVSPGAEYLAFGDADGQVHLWTSTSNASAGVPLNGYEGVKAEWPDAVEPSNVVMDDATPLSAIGMPYYSESLLSNFPEDDYAPVTSPFFNPPEPVPQSVLASMKMVDFVGYAGLPNELKGKRYVRTARPGAGKRATGKGWSGHRRDSGRFRSEKRQAAEEEEDATPDGGVPKWYRKVEIKYSRFGVEDFDFGFYNRTQYSGLETDILNSYTNALLQTLHYSAPIRAVAKAHICVECEKEHCLLCEAGFLFRMLEDAKGINCQASNFCRAFSATPQGLMDDETGQPYGTMIQSLNRWLLSTFSSESQVGALHVRKPDLGHMSLSETSPIDQILGIKTRTTNSCTSCRAESSRETTMQVIDLQHRRTLSTSSISSGSTSTSTRESFCDILRASLLRESETRATCSTCKKFTRLASRRSLAGSVRAALPPVLSVNTMAMSSGTSVVDTDMWHGRFLPARIAVEEQQGELTMREAREGETGLVYAVQSVVVQIQDGDAAPHLVSFVKRWLLFNDFLVRPVSEEEVFTFTAWKTPAIITFQREDAGDVLQLDKLPTQLDSSVLLRDVSLAWNRRNHLIKHSTLRPDELPLAGTRIAIDAEFVALQQEELEFRSDGTKRTLRPSHMSLARVSVLRETGQPFIDDYILTKEAVVDYLTEYSGIKSGDLDVNNSVHTLVPLKVAYKKLRLLVDLGCVFIGHGLAKDFRTINIFVPPEQILDTVHIYTVPSRQRKLSLRFLTWYVLKVDIQTAAHDSIEDAKYALLLYKAYEAFRAENRFEDVMDEIFEEGQKMGFKPPHETRPMSPALPPDQPAVPAVNTPRKPSSRSTNWRERSEMGSPAASVAGSSAGRESPAPRPRARRPRKALS